MSHPGYGKRQKTNEHGQKIITFDLSQAFHVSSVTNNDIFEKYNHDFEKWFDKEYDYDSYILEKWQDSGRNGIFQRDLEVSTQNKMFTDQIKDFIHEVFPVLQSTYYKIKHARLRLDPTEGTKNLFFHTDAVENSDSKDEVTMILSLTEDSLPYTVYLDGIKDQSDCVGKKFEYKPIKDASTSFKRLKYGDIAVHKTSICHSSPGQEQGVSRKIMILILSGNHIRYESLCELMASGVNPNYGTVSSVTPLRL